MEQSFFLPVLLFSISMTATPGPNNMLLTAVGARFGYRRCLPLIAGIVLGLVSQLFLSGFGLGALFLAVPQLRVLLRWAGALYLLYLAFRIASSRTGKEGERSPARPPTLLQGAALQYLNPKAYLMTVTAVTVYAAEGNRYLLSTVLIAILFSVVTPLSVSLWAGFGSLIGRFLSRPGWGRGVNLALGGMTALSVLFLFI